MIDKLLLDTRVEYEVVQESGITLYKCNSTLLLPTLKGLISALKKEVDDNTQVEIAFAKASSFTMLARVSKDNVKYLVQVGSVKREVTPEMLEKMAKLLRALQ